MNVYKSIEYNYFSKHSRIELKLKEDKKYLLWSMTNNVVQVEVRIEANSTIGHVSKEKLPKSGTDFESENVWIHCEKEN
jgi:hypothetical protein